MHVWGPITLMFSHLFQKEHCSDLVLEAVI